MTVGEKIKKIRTFRGMTQKELGLAVGFEEKGADNRIAQYETNYRVPKRELLDKIAQALRVESQNFYTLRPGCAEDFMRTFFWLDEDSPGSIRLFQLVRNPGNVLTLVSDTLRAIAEYSRNDRTEFIHTVQGFLHAAANQFFDLALDYFLV